MGQVDFGPLSTASGKGIETEEAAFELMHAFSNGDAVPAQFAFGSALTARAKGLDGAGHKEPSVTAFERRGGVDQEGFVRVRQLHTDTSSLGSSGSIGSQGGIV